MNERKPENQIKKKLNLGDKKNKSSNKAVKKALYQ